MPMNLRTFMNSLPVCLVLRLYAPDPDDVPFRVEQAVETIAAFDQVMVCGRPSVKQILILVFADQRYGSRADCGQTYDALHQALGPRLKDRSRVPVKIENVWEGEPCAAMLNLGWYLSGRLGCDHTLIFSPDAHQYVTEGNLEALYMGCVNGAKVSGLVFDGYEDVLLESGGVSNACAVWNNRALAISHGFDEFSAMPLRQDEIETNADGSVVVHGGAEEWPILGRLWKTFEKPCIATVMPVDRNAAYQTPDRVTQRVLWERHQALRRTKLERRDAALAHVKSDRDLLIRAVMPDCRGNLMR